MESKNKTRDGRNTCPSDQRLKKELDMPADSHPICLKMWSCLARISRQCRNISSDCCVEMEMIEEPNTSEG